MLEYGDTSPHSSVGAAQVLQVETREFKHLAG